MKQVEITIVTKSRQFDNKEGRREREERLSSAFYYF